jgi:hypothetical protein
MFCERNFIIGTHRLGNLKIFIFLFGRLELNVSKLEALYFSHVPSPFCSNYFSDGGLILLPGLASDRGPTWDPSWDYRCVPPYLAISLPSLILENVIYFVVHGIKSFTVV